jgi:hypothetical protein
VQYVFVFYNLLRLEAEQLYADYYAQIDNAENRRDVFEMRSDSMRSRPFVQGAFLVFVPIMTGVLNYRHPFVGSFNLDTGSLGRGLAI